MSDLTPGQLAAQFNRLIERNKAALMTQSVAIVERHAKHEAPVGTYRGGTLRRDIAGRAEDGGNRGVIGFSVKHGRYVIEGTGLYGPRKTLIVPKSKRGLAFMVGGAMIVRRSVKGQKPNPFMTRALVGSKSDVQRGLVEWGQAVLKKVG